jgi:hypothetical protein
MRDLFNGTMPDTDRMSFEERILALYDYTDEAGKMLFQAVRLWAPPPKNKDFRQRRPDGKGGWDWKLGDTRRVLFHLPQLLAALPTEPVFVCEGEKDVLALERCGLVATTNPMGAGKWRPEFADWFKGRTVYVPPDNDEPGRKHAAEVRESLLKVAAQVRVVALPGLPEKGDVSDWIDAKVRGIRGEVNYHAIGAELVRFCESAPPANLSSGSSPATETAGPPPAELILRPLEGLKVKPVKYLIPNRLPAGKLVLCGGRGGEGKSTLMRSIAADLSAGRCCLGLQYDNPARVKVLIVAAEDGPEDTILPGLLAEGADVSRIALLEGVRRGTAKRDFTLSPEDIGLIRDRLAKSPDIKLIIIDPIASFVGRCKINDHRATELRLILDPLSALAEETGVTIVMIAHLNKSTGDAVDRIAGSAAYRDAVRAAYLVGVDPDDESRRLFMPVKENLPGFHRSAIPFSRVPFSDDEAAAILAREEFRHLEGDDLAAVRSQLARIKFDNAVSMDPNAAFKSKKQDDSTKVQRCKEWLKTFLAKYAYPSQEITTAAKASGFTFDNVKEAKAALKNEGIITHNNDRFPGGWWSGPGLAPHWTPRPEPLPTTPHTPDFPTPPHTPHSSPHPLTEREREEDWGGEGRTGDRGGDGSFEAPTTAPDGQLGEGGTL